MAINLSQFVTAVGAIVSSVSAVFSSAVSSGNSIMIVGGAFRDASNVLPSTVTDNVNNAGYTQRILSTMSNAIDTNCHLLQWDKLNLSSGSAASTYRVNSSAPSNMSFAFCAMEYSGGPMAFGSTISANGTSSGPAAGNLTASSTPFLIVSGAVHNGSVNFASTATGGANFVATVDPTFTAQIVNVVRSTDNSSLQKNIGHSLSGSTRWLAASVLYTGAGAGGGAVDYPNPWMLGMMGVQ